MRQKSFSNLGFDRHHKTTRRERWLGKLGQPDKWISCLTAAILPPTRREHDGANPPDA